jgi:site-specific DNA-methyltransferase (adenine-specific)
MSLSNIFLDKTFHFNKEKKLSIKSKKIKIQESEIEKYEPKTNEALEWKGWGTSFISAYQPIICASVPIDSNGKINNILKYKTGAFNIGAVGYNNTDDPNGKKRVPCDVWIECTCNEKTYAKPTKNGSQAFLNHTNPECPCFKLDKEYSESLSSKIGNTKPHAPLSSNYKIIFSAGSSKIDKNEGLEDFVSDRDINARDKKRRFYTTKQKNDVTEKNIHPTVKSTELMKELIKNIAKPGDMLIDPFFGSGSTVKACIQLDNNIHFIGIEIDKNYYEESIYRCTYEQNFKIKK